MISEILTVIEAVDPISLPLWATVFASALMYPLGLLLGGPCSPCCAECSCPGGQTLPDTLTVTFSNFPNEKAPTIWLINLTFSSTFYTAQGGAAHATSPDICGTEASFPPDCWGPIGGIVVTDGGSNYAKIGHRQPIDVRIDPTPGDFDGIVARGIPTWVEFSNGEYYGFPAWAASEPVEITAPGTKYRYGMAVDLLTDEGQPGENASNAAHGWTKVKQDPPTLSISGGTGDGLVASMNIRLHAWTQQQPAPYEGMAAWEFDSATIINGGFGYKDGDFLTVEIAEDDVVVTQAEIVARTIREEPSLIALVQSEIGGGAVLDVVMTQVQTPAVIPQFYSPLWRATAVTVQNGGSGYPPGTLPVTFMIADGTLEYFAYPATGTAIIGSNGSVISVSVDLPNTAPFSNFYYKDTGIVYNIECYPFSNSCRGLYYKTDGKVTQVVLPAGASGTYYVEDPTIQPFVADIDVNVSQYPPSEGEGATFNVVVDQVVGSETFGQIIAVQVINGGDEYLARWWNNSQCCGSFYDGKSFVVKRAHLIEPFGEQAGSPYPYVFPGVDFPEGRCVYAHNYCGTHKTDAVDQVHWSSLIVEYPGENRRPIVRIERDGGCALTMTSTTPAECDGLSFTALATEGDETGPTAIVTAGGDFNPFNGFPLTQNNGCTPCCRASAVPPDLIMATIIDSETDQPIAFYVNPSTGEEYKHVVMAAVFAGTWAYTNAFIVITTCSSESAGGGWQPKPAGSPSYPDLNSYCDECWRQCEASFFMPGAAGGGWLYTLSCSNCTEGPLCSPLSAMIGRRTLYSDYDTGPNGTFVPGFGWIPGVNKIGQPPPFETKYRLVVEAVQ